MRGRHPPVWTSKLGRHVFSGCHHVDAWRHYAQCKHLWHIIDIELAKLFKRIEDIGYTLKLSAKAKDYIADKGFDKDYGARPLKRAIQKYIEDALAEEIINSNLQEGDTISMDLDAKTNELKIKIKKKKKTTES